MALLPFCSYSEPYSYGITPNAASKALNWSMATILPDEAGLTVSGVIYRYTAHKNVADAMQVHVQNENALGSGLIFRETDNWTGLPGQTINKMVPVDNIPIQYWGNGSIQVDGTGSVTDANVVYTYKIDHCFDPQSDPTCPGYKQPMPQQTDIQIYNELEDPALQNKKSQFKYISDDEKKSQNKEQELKNIESVIEDANSIAQDAVLLEMNFATNLNTYYNKSLRGGVYKEQIVLVDAKIPESKFGLRNGLAQQVLHQRMVDKQYER